MFVCMSNYIWGSTRFNYCNKKQISIHDGKKNLEAKEKDNK